MSKHTLAGLLEDQPAVLTRVPGLVPRRGFHPDSLAVGPTEHPVISRMTIVVDVQGLPLEQVTKQLNKQINVLKVVELEDNSAVKRGLLVVKFRTDIPTRSHILEVVELFRARVIDVVPEALTIEATGDPDKLDAFLSALEPFDIREIVKSGAVAIGRGARSITDRTVDRNVRIA